MPTSASAHAVGGRPGQGDALLARKAANQRGGASTTLAAPGRRSVSSQRSDGSEAWGTLGPASSSGRATTGARDGGPAVPPPWVPAEVPQHHHHASLPRARSTSTGSQGAARPSWAPDATPAAPRHHQAQAGHHLVHAPTSDHTAATPTMPRHYAAGDVDNRWSAASSSTHYHRQANRAPPADAFEHDNAEGDDEPVYGSRQAASARMPAPATDGGYGYHEFSRAPLDRPHHDVTRPTPAPWELRRDAALADASAYGRGGGGASQQHSSLVAPRDVRLSTPLTTSHASLTTSAVSRDASLSEQLRAKDRLIEELLQSRRELDGELHRLKSAHEAERSAIRAEAHAEFMHALRHGGIVAVERLAAESGADELGAAAPPKDLHDVTGGGHASTAAATASTPRRQLPGGVHFKPSTPLPHTRDNPRAREEAADRVRNALRLLNRPSTPPAGGTGYRPQSYPRSPSMGH